MAKTILQKIMIFTVFLLIISGSLLYAANVKLVMNFQNEQKSVVVSTSITFDQLFTRFQLLFEKYNLTPSMIEFRINGTVVDSTGSLIGALFEYRSQEYAAVPVDISYTDRGRAATEKPDSNSQSPNRQSGIDPNRVKVSAELAAKKALQTAAGKGGEIKRKLDGILNNLGRDEIRIRLDGDENRADTDYDVYRGKEVIRLILEKKLTFRSLYWNPQQKKWITVRNSARFQQMFSQLSGISLDDRILVDYSEANSVLKNAGLDPSYQNTYIYPVREWLQ